MRDGVWWQHESLISQLLVDQPRAVVVRVKEGRQWVLPPLQQSQR
jgi:hypothetical protein